MKKKYPYPFRVSGLVGAVISILLLLLAQFGISLIKTEYIELALFLFLYIAAFSKDKTEDEHIAAIRASSFRNAFLLAMATCFAFGITVQFSEDALPVDLVFFANICLTGYHLLYYASKHIVKQ
jgi:hypothetical protein